MPEESHPTKMPRWSAAKTALLLLLPSIIYIIFGTLSMITQIGGFIYVSVFFCPLLALVLAILATREFAGKSSTAGAYVGWGIVWILAHAGVLLTVGFGGCTLISDAIGYWDPY